MIGAHRKPEPVVGGEFIGEVEAHIRAGQWEDNQRDQSDNQVNFLQMCFHSG
jgi:hypothetical protein